MRLTYANVVSTLALFLVLTGGAAYAAHRFLTRRSVGAPQLKAGAVTTAKIKASAVTTRKIKRIAVSSEKLKEGAVTTEKLANGAVNTEKIDLGEVPFSRVSARLRSAATLALQTEPQIYPLTGSTYTQAADELDSFAGELKVSIPAKCSVPRVISAYVLVGAKDPTKPSEEEDKIVAAGSLTDQGPGALNATIELQPGPRQMLFEPGVPTSRSVSLVAAAKCEGGGSGVTAASGAVDVVATR